MKSFKLVPDLWNLKHYFSSKYCNFSQCKLQQDQNLTKMNISHILENNGGNFTHLETWGFQISVIFFKSVTMEQHSMVISTRNGSILFIYLCTHIHILHRCYISKENASSEKLTCSFTNNWRYFDLFGEIIKLHSWGKF